MRVSKILTLVFILSSLIMAQSWIDQSRGGEVYRKTVTMKANNVQTVTGNWQSIGKFQENNAGIWPKGTKHNHILEAAFFTAAEVTGTDGNTYHVISESYSENPNLAPDGHGYWWNPLPGYANENRKAILPDGTIDATSQVAHSADPTTWPSSWPGKDASWNGKWNGYFGAGQLVADDEAYYVTDDASNNKYPYYPFPGDTTRRGLGLQCETRLFQWANTLMLNSLFIHYKITNASPVNYNQNIALGIFADVCPGGTLSTNDVDSFDSDNSIVITYAYQDKGYWTDNTDILPGYMACKILETPKKPDGSARVGITSFTAPVYGSVWMKNEDQLWGQIQPGTFVNPVQNANLLWILASGQFNLASRQTVPYSSCWLFAADNTTLLNDAKNAQTIYNYNYNPSGMVRHFSASSYTIEQGQSAVISWKATDGSTVELNGTQVNTADSITVQPGQDTKYTLNTTGVVADSKEFTVKFNPPGVIKSFTVDNPVIELGVSDSSQLKWSVTKGSEVTLNGTPVSIDGSEKVFPKATTQYVLIVKGNAIDTSIITVQALPTDKVNRALNHIISASQSLDGCTPDKAVDGNNSSYWQSQVLNPQWITIDLGREVIINRVVLNWGASYASVYQLQAIDESNDTTGILTNNNGKGGIDDFGITSNIEARYVRLLVLNNNYQDIGCRLNEFQVFGTLKTTDIKDESKNGNLPKAFSLEQNYPNPFNPSTIISWQLPAGSFVTLKLYDILGKEITTLVNEYQNAGVHSISFNTQQLAGGRQLSSGIYLYRMQATANSEKSGSFISTKKMILLK